MKKLILLLPLCFFLIHCEEQETDDLYSAQVCINSATSATVDACLTKIAGYSSPMAFSLRCSADFIREGITDTRIVNALERIDENDDPSIDPMTDLISFLTFDDVPAADQAVTNCTASGSEGLTVLSEIVKLGTNLIIGSGLPITADGVDPAALDTFLDSASSGSFTAQELEGMAESIIALQPIACGDSGSFKDEEVCVNINDAIAAGTDTTTLINTFLTELQSDEP